MIVAWLVVVLGGATCEAVTVCDASADSCEAVIVSCDAPVGLDACWDGYAAGRVESEEWATVLGCSTDLARGWPAGVDLDRDELAGAL